MSEAKESQCGCNTCPGPGCTCGCQKGSEQSQCACGPQCGCGDSCLCAQFENAQK
jgi:hypothetical protein